MPVITDSQDLAAFCKRQESADFITVDTEFLRDQTYWPKLCLLQIAGPEEAVAVDTLAPGIDLAPVEALFAQEALVKVLHSARQDMEIFLLEFGCLPHPIFDTQIAAMVCGFGDSVGYDTLVRRLVGKRIDKGSRFTDWSRRPLSESQINYALGDVTHLRQVYRKLGRRLEKHRRAHWLDAEMEILTSPDTYRLEPENAWRRLKTRSSDRLYLAVLQALAAWREREARSRNVPRNRVIRDEQLFDIAAQRPKTPEALARTRGFNPDNARGRFGRAVIAAVEEGLALPKDQRPFLPERRDFPAELVPVLEMLRLLMKIRCAEVDVAPKLVANGQDLELIAQDDAADVPALEGWRREIFGADALRLKHGEIALTIHDKRIETIERLESSQKDDEA